MRKGREHGLPEMCVCEAGQKKLKITACPHGLISICSPKARCLLISVVCVALPSTSNFLYLKFPHPTCPAVEPLYILLDSRRCHLLCGAFHNLLPWPCSPSESVKQSLSPQSLIRLLLEHLDCCLLYAFQSPPSQTMCFLQTRTMNCLSSLS